MHNVHTDYTAFQMTNDKTDTKEVRSKLHI